ncbi:MAG: hypothetical protein ACRD0K_09600 [Egibacteraceae bacterium]
MGHGATDLFQLAGLAVAVGGVAVSVLLRRLDRGHRRREGAEARGRARDRAVMLRRVRYRWITGVLEQSLTAQVRIRLGLAYRPDAVLQIMDGRPLWGVSRVPRPRRHRPGVAGGAARRAHEHVSHRLLSGTVTKPAFACCRPSIGPHCTLGLTSGVRTMVASARGR